MAGMVLRVMSVIGRLQSARDPQRSITVTEQMFEDLGDPVVARRGCKVVGGRDRLWMTA